MRIISKILSNRVKKKGGERTMMILSPCTAKIHKNKETYNYG